MSALESDVLSTIQAEKQLVSVAGVQMAGVPALRCIQLGVE